MRAISYFFWQSSGVVSSLADLPVSKQVPFKKDVSLLIEGKNPTPHPLLVAELAGGKIIADLRLAATCDDKIIGGIQAVAGCDDVPNHYAVRRQRFRLPKYRRGTALLLSGSNGDNYYHWLMETLPRWRILQAAGILHYDYVLLPSRTMRFQTETVNRLQIPPEKILRPSKNFVHQFDRLIVPSMPYPLRQIAPWVCEWLRSLFPVRRNGPEKIFLVRRNEPRRRLVNESELETRLQQLGFVSVQPEKLTVAEQADLFSTARCVVASHGAGLSNMAFAPAGTLLVELLHPEVVLRPTYKNLAAGCGFRYASITGRQTNDSLQSGGRLNEFQIDVAEVLQALAING